MKQWIAAALQVAGGVSLAVAGFLVHVVAGFVVAGVLAVVFGIALERELVPVSGPAAETGADLAMPEKRGEV